jgi:hypothetical protein
MQQPAGRCGRCCLVSMLAEEWLRVGLGHMVHLAHALSHAWQLCPFWGSTHCQTLMVAGPCTLSMAQIHAKCCTAHFVAAQRGGFSVEH